MACPKNHDVLKQCHLKQSGLAAFWNKIKNTQKLRKKFKKGEREKKKSKKEEKEEEERNLIR